MARSTVDSILQRFVADDCRAVNRRKNCGRTPRCFEAETLRFILDRAELEHSVHLSLPQRCARITRITGEAIRPWKLRDIYLRNGIKRVRPQSTYIAELKKDQVELAATRLGFG